MGEVHVPYRTPVLTSAAVALRETLNDGPVVLACQ